MNMVAAKGVWHADSVVTIDMRHGLPESRVRGLHILSDGRLAVLTAGYLCVFDGNTFRSNPIDPGKGVRIESIGKNRMMFQDSVGRIWVKTPVTRLDAARVHVFNGQVDRDITETVLGHIEGVGIRGLFGDESGNVWIIDKENTLGRLVDGNVKTDLNLSMIGSDVPVGLSVRSGRIYLLYENGKVCVVNKDSGLLEFVSSPSLPKGDFRLLNTGIKWHGDSLWLSFYSPFDKNTGLIAVLNTADGTWNLRQFPKIINEFLVNDDGSITYDFKDPDVEVSSIASDGNRGVWIGTSTEGLRYINPIRLRLVGYSDSVYKRPKTGYYPTERSCNIGEKYARGLVNSSAEDSVTGYVYLGTRKGLFVIDGNDRMVGIIDEKYGLPNNNVQSVVANVGCSDVNSDSGDVWFATATGLSRLRHTSEDSFEVINIGILDGLDLGGKEFMSQSMMTDSCGRLTVAYPGGYCFLDPSDVRDGDYVVYSFPAVSAESSMETGGVKWLRILWWTVGILAIGCLCCVFLFRRKRNQVSAVENITSESTTETYNPVVDDIGSDNGTVDIGQVYNNLVSKVKEESRPPADESQVIDKDFEKRLYGIISRHIDDESLNVASLSSIMAMDRTNLYRKMQSMFGLSPSVYIRNIRLEAAARLLRETDLSVADIAMRTGFSSAKYLSAIFKEKYGVLPTKYRCALP